MWQAHIGIHVAMEDIWFITGSIVRGYRFYKDECTPTMYETIQRLWEGENREDRLAVGVYV